MLRAMDALDAEPRDPWHFVRVILVHPDVRDDIAAKCAPATDTQDTIFGWIAGIEILTSVYVMKSRAHLLDSDRRILGWMDLATGECYFAPEQKPRYLMDPTLIERPVVT